MQVKRIPVTFVPEGINSFSVVLNVDEAIFSDKIRKGKKVGVQLNSGR